MSASWRGQVDPAVSSACVCKQLLKANRAAPREFGNVPGYEMVAQDGANRVAAERAIAIAPFPAPACLSPGSRARRVCCGLWHRRCSFLRTSPIRGLPPPHRPDTNLRTSPSRSGRCGDTRIGVMCQVTGHDREKDHRSLVKNRAGSPLQVIGKRRRRKATTGKTHA